MLRFVLLPVILTQSLLGVNLLIAPFVGSMQQPTSNYYLGIGGIEMGMETDSHGVAVLVRYFERPEFRRAGYAEKDAGEMLLLGTELVRSEPYSLSSYWGYGLIRGYVDDISNDESEEYAMRGPVLELEASAEILGLDFSFSHATFLGSASDEDLEFYVLWPFQFFFIKMGYRW